MADGGEGDDVLLLVTLGLGGEYGGVGGEEGGVEVELFHADGLFVDLLVDALGVGTGRIAGVDGRSILYRGQGRRGERVEDALPVLFSVHDTSLLLFIIHSPKYV